MSDAAGVGRALLIAGGYVVVFAMTSRELFRALDPRVVMVSGLRLERPWFRRFVQSFFAVGAFATLVAPLMLLLDSSLGPGRWFFFGTLIFDAVWLAGLVKQLLAENMP